MANTIVRIYDKFLDAQKAREELLAAGFSSSDVQLQSTDDEAGDMKGNFTVGDTVTDSAGGLKGFFHALTGGKEQIYENGFTNPHRHGRYILTVDGEDEQLTNASHIMNRFGAMDVDARTRNSRN